MGLKDNLAAPIDKTPLAGLGKDFDGGVGQAQRRSSVLVQFEMSLAPHFSAVVGAVTNVANPLNGFIGKPLKRFEN